MLVYLAIVESWHHDLPLNVDRFPVVTMHDATHAAPYAILPANIDLTLIFTYHTSWYNVNITRRTTGPSYMYMIYAGFRLRSGLNSVHDSDKSGLLYI